LDGCGISILSGDIHIINIKEAKLEELASVEADTLVVGEVAITYSDKFNKNGIGTMERKSEMVTNVKEYDEAHIPIVRNRLPDLEDGANLTYV